MTTTANKTATYKGHTYRLLFVGDTRFGRRAKLGFVDGSKEFWVDASAVTEHTNGGELSARCCRCGERLHASELSPRSLRRAQSGKPTCCPDCFSGAAAD